MFTIIIPTHDRPLLLRRTLQSLIEQTYKNFTVIIVGDSSTYLPPYDELLALQGRYIYIIRSGAKGPAESRNMGLALALSQYVMFLDDDDTFEPGHLQAIANRIEKNSPELLFCDFKVRHEDRTKPYPEHLSTDEIDLSEVTKDSLYIRNRIPNSCAVFRRDVIGGIRFESNMIIYEDWDFLLQCLHGRSLGYLPINSVVIHKSAANAPENMRRGNTNDEKIVEVMLQLYKKHPAPDMQTRLGRQALLASAKVYLGLEHF